MANQSESARGAAGDKSASLTDGGFLRRHRKGRKEGPPERKLDRQESFVISGELDGVGGKEGGRVARAMAAAVTELLASRSVSLSLIEIGVSVCLSAGGFLSISDLSHSISLQ